MRCPQWNFTARLLLGLGVAAVLTAVLTVLTAPTTSAAAARSPAWPGPAPLPPLCPDRGPVLLLAASAAVPPDLDLLLRIDADGAVQLLQRPTPRLVPPPWPLLVPPPRRAIALPVRDLARLSPLARGSLLECLGALLAARPVTSCDLRLGEVQATSAELRRLLSWVR